MAKKDKFQELKKLSKTELKEKLSNAVRSLYELGLSLRANQTKDHKEYRALKKERARINTILNSQQ